MADAATTTLEYLAAIGTGAMLFIVIAHIISRYVFNAPLYGMNEYVGNVTMPIVVFIGFITSVARHQTIEADIIYDRFPVRIRREVRFFTSLACSVVSAFFVYFTFLEAVHSTEIGRTAPASTIPTWWVYWLVPFSFACLTWLFFVDAIRAIRGRFDRENSFGEAAALIAGGGESDLADEPLTEFATDPDAPAPGEPVDPGPVHALKNWIWRVVLGGLILAATILIFTFEARLHVGLTVIALMLVLMLMRMPVAYVMAIPGLIGIIALAGPRAAETLLTSAAMGSSATWAMAVLPMFMIMGIFLGNSGLTTSMYTTMRNWLYWLPGGLAVGTNMAGMGLAAVSGSTLGTTYSIGRVGVPEMFRAGYSKWLAIGAVITSGLPGQLIPPSVSLIIMAGLLGVPAGPALMAGVLPGITVAILFSLNIILFAMIFPSWGGRVKDAPKVTITWKDRWVSLARIWPVAALMIFVFGGMFGGVFTTSEASAAGAFGALVLLVIFQWKNKPHRLILDSALETVSSTGAIFLMIVGSAMFASVIALSGIGTALKDFVQDAGFTRVTFLLFALVIYIILGTFMDPIPMMLTTIPFVAPLLGPLGIDPLWYAVFAVFMGEIAILSPPVGLLTFVIHKMVQEPHVGLGKKITVNDVFNSVWMFLPMSAIVVFLWILFPELATWLPSMMVGR